MRVIVLNYDIRTLVLEKDVDKYLSNIPDEFRKYHTDRIHDVPDEYIEELEMLDIRREYLSELIMELLNK